MFFTSRPILYRKLELVEIISTGFEIGIELSDNEPRMKNDSHYLPVKPFKLT
jgi:hypothetical protein